MARQSGPLKYKGTLGDVRHFKIKGLPGYFAGLIGGPTAEQVKTAPEFERTRENMNEFGGSASAGKSVRVGLAQLIKQMADNRITGRLTAVMKKINLEDTSGVRGYRSILISQYPQYLQGFSFNKSVSFDSILYAPYTMVPAVTRDSVDVNIPDFNPMNFINAPSGATHFRIVSAISVISDFQFNSASQLYEPTSALLNEISNVAYSGFIDLSNPSTGAININNPLPGTPTMTPDVMVINCIGIEFYQEVGGNYYIFNSGNALKIQNLF
jgi:hypothetical protein